MSEILKNVSTRDKKPKFNPGSTRAMQRLKELGFDPIGALVDKYKELEYECKRQEEIRNGTLVDINPATGKVRSYYVDGHMSIIDKQIQIADKLLRYKYGRVPEVEEKEESKSALIINLTPKGGEFSINNAQDDEEFY